MKRFAPTESKAINSLSLFKRINEVDDLLFAMHTQLHVDVLHVRSHGVLGHNQLIAM